MEGVLPEHGTAAKSGAAGRSRPETGKKECMKTTMRNRVIAIMSTVMLALTVYVPMGGAAFAVESNAAGQPAETEAAEVPEAAEATGSFDSDRWDGSVDISWYDPEETEFTLTKPAQLAGMAALVNGMTSVEVTDDMFKGNDKLDINTPAELREKCTIKETKTTTGTGAGSKTSVIYYGKKEYDFMGKTVKLGADLDMGATFDGSKSFNRSTWKDDRWSGPNWTPVGGSYPMDIKDYTNKENDPDLPYRWFKDRDGNDIDLFLCDSTFNGTFDGQGHTIYNIYCDRYTAKDFMWSQNIALFGSVGHLYEDDRGDQKE